MLHFWTFLPDFVVAIEKVFIRCLLHERHPLPWCSFVAFRVVLWELSCCMIYMLEESLLTKPICSSSFFCRMGTLQILVFLHLCFPARKGGHRRAGAHVWMRQVAYFSPRLARVTIAYNRNSKKRHIIKNGILVCHLRVL